MVQGNFKMYWFELIAGGWRGGAVVRFDPSKKGLGSNPFSLCLRGFGLWEENPYINC